jgi:hypothetical protein
MLPVLRESEWRPIGRRLHPVTGRLQNMAAVAAVFFEGGRLKTAFVQRPCDRPW